MRNFIFLTIILLASCVVSDKDIVVEKWITAAQERDSLLYKIIVLTDKLPKGATYENRDSIVFKNYYSYRMRMHQLVNYYEKNSVVYYQFYKIVPSLFNEKCAFAGKFKVDDNGEIYDFEEIYVTPKMSSADLKERGNVLFKKLVRDDTVGEYVMNKDFIEFPDSLSHYNKDQQRWVFKYENWLAK